MGISGGPNISGDENLAFIYDVADPNSYAGEPTTNIYGTSFRDFTGTTYSPDGEWTSNATQLTKTYNSTLPTPIGPGATLIQESGGSGYHHLSRYGGGDESGLHTISCYLYPLTSSITDFTIGMLGDGGNMIRFNLNTRQITYGGGISNRNAIIQDVPGSPGWLRVGANIEGRFGGWVGCLGYSADTSYTGTSGAKKCYITGIQYEYKDHVTQFTTGTRSISGSLFDLSSNKYQLTLNTSYNSSAQIVFDGTDDYIIGTPLNRLLVHSIESIFRPTSHPTYGASVVSDQYSTVVNYKLGYEGVGVMAGGFYDGGWRLTPNITTTLNAWHHVVYTYDGSNLTIYKNGLLIGTNLYSGSPNTNGLSLRIGRRWDNPDYFAGDIPIVRIYNRALLASEVRQNYDQLKSRFNL
jgi:hypothetical protein